MFICVCLHIQRYQYIDTNIQCNPDIRVLSGSENKSLITVFGLFCFGNIGSNLRPGFLLYQCLTYSV